MDTQRFSPEFETEAVRQVLGEGDIRLPKSGLGMAFLRNRKRLL
jgi:hypothetical protein